MTIKNIDRIEKINEENRLLLKELINLGFDIKS